MALYRVLKRLDVGRRVIPAGSFLGAGTLNPEAIQRLLNVGALGELHAPPLSELPGLDSAAEQLALIGIFNADQLLECDIDKTAEQIGVTPDTVSGWVDIAGDWLTIPEPPRHG